MRLGMKEVSGDLVGGKNWEIVLSDGNLSFFFLRCFKWRWKMTQNVRNYVISDGNFLIRKIHELIFSDYQISKKFYRSNIYC